MWKIKITYTDRSKLALSGRHKDIPLELAIKYFNEYVANCAVYSAVYQQYPKKAHAEMALLEKIDELQEQEMEDSDDGE